MPAADLPPSPPRRDARPVLCPGVHVVRRDDRHLQVGIDPPRAVVLTDSPETRELLEALRRGEPPADPSVEQRHVIEALAERRLVVDATDRDGVLRGAADRSAAAALLAAAGADAPGLLADRSRTRVAVSAPVDLRSGLVRLLRSSALELAAEHHEADLVLVVSDTVLPREALDALVRDARAHMVVSPHLDGVEVGPLVVPGTTACLRCVDAHRGERDPRRSVVLEQCADHNRASGPVPRDPALMSAAVALAVRDAACWADGEQPLSWSATLALRPGRPPLHRSWRRHPHCGCAWDQLAG